MSKPIYVPKGKAKEYGDYAINIYTGCPHRCFYCFAPNVLHRDRETFHTNVKPRENIVEEVRKQVDREHITGQLIHLCFTCDPYPTGYDSTPTREIIKILKESADNPELMNKPTENLSQEEIDSVLQRYMSKFVMQQIMNGIANNAIRFSDTLDEIAHIEDAVEQLIEQSVSDAFAQVRRDNTELTNEKVKEITDRVYMTTVEILEGVGD